MSSNVHLVDFSKSLNSEDISKQLNAVCSIPSLIEKFPYPGVINSVFLNVIEVFKKSNNFIKLYIVKSLSNCKSYMNDESFSEIIVSNLLPLLSSNDPISRALVIQFFGIFSYVLIDQTIVHQFILDKIRSSYKIELESAIISAREFAKISEPFSVNLMKIIEELLGDQSYDLMEKYSLILLSKTINHNIEMNQTMKGCLNNIFSVLDIEYFDTILNSLTHLELNNPFTLYNHIEFCIKKLPHKDFFYRIIGTLDRINQELFIKWKDDHFEDLFNYLQSDSLDVKMHERLVDFLISISERNQKIALAQNAKEYLGEHLVTLTKSQSKDLSIFDLKLFLLTLQLSNSFKKQTIFDAIYFIFFLPQNDIFILDEKFISEAKIIKKILQRILLLSEKSNILTKDQIVIIINRTIEKDQNELSILFIEFLTNFDASVKQDETCIQNIFSKLKMSPVLDHVQIIRIIRAFGYYEIESEFFNLLHSTEISYWDLFRLGRDLSLAGIHHLAKVIYSELSLKTKSLQHSIWLKGLQNLAMGFPRQNTFKYQINTKSTSKEITRFYTEKIGDISLRKRNLNNALYYFSLLLEKRFDFVSNYSRLCIHLHEFLERIMQTFSLLHQLSRGLIWYKSKNYQIKLISEMIKSSKCLSLKSHAILQKCIDVDQTTLDRINELLHWNQKVETFLLNMQILYHKDLKDETYEEDQSMFIAEVDYQIEEFFNNFLNVKSIDALNQWPRAIFNQTKSTSLESFINLKNSNSKGDSKNQHLAANKIHIFTTIGRVKVENTDSNQTKDQFASMDRNLSQALVTLIAKPKKNNQEIATDLETMSFQKLVSLTNGIYNCDFPIKFATKVGLNKIKYCISLSTSLIDKMGRKWIPRSNESDDVIQVEIESGV